MKPAKLNDTLKLHWCVTLGCLAFVVLSTFNLSGQSLSIRYCYDGMESVTTYTNALTTLLTPPSLNGESRKAVAVVGGGVTTITGAPNAIIIEALYPNNHEWVLQWTTNATDWNSTAPINPGLTNAQNGCSFALVNPPARMSFRLKTL